MGTVPPNLDGENPLVAHACDGEDEVEGAAAHARHARPAAPCARQGGRVVLQVRKDHVLTWEPMSERMLAGGGLGSWEQLLGEGVGALRCWEGVGVGPLGRETCTHKRVEEPQQETHSGTHTDTTHTDTTHTHMRTAHTHMRTAHTHTHTHTHTPTRARARLWDLT